MSDEKKLVYWMVGSPIALFLFILILSSFGTIDTGNVGIKTSFGKVIGTIQPGLYFKIPIIQGVTEMDVQTQKEQATASAASKDLQTVNAQVAINYRVDDSKAADLYSRIGTDYKSRIIDPAIQEVVKAVTAQYTAEELITKRPEITDKIQAGLAERLSPSDITISNPGVSITNFDFSQSFNAAIEAKVTAEQNALAAQNKLVQVKAEAEQTVATAKAQAQAIQIQAQAINSQGGADYVALQKIQKWDGAACTSYCGIEAMTNLISTK